MSSVQVREDLIDFLETNAPTEKIVDLSGAFDEIQDFLNKLGITPQSPWVGVQFVGSDETPITLSADNSKGTYRERGSIYIHVVERAKIAATSAILTRAETLRDLLRGRRIGSIVVEAVTPANFGPGATLSFEGGYMSASFIVGYYRDLIL